MLRGKLGLWHADNKSARDFADRIDLSKAWDDPANVAAGKTIVWEFLAPGEVTVRNEQGFAVSHFAMVRGSNGLDNGMFPDDGHSQLVIPDIKDGTVNTLALGQIKTKLGPWIAAGTSTARFFYPPTAQSQTPGFCSQHVDAAYFANGDGFTYFLDMSATNSEALVALAGRDDGVIVDVSTLPRYSSATEWKKSKNQGAKVK